jgi:hypothetical protein
LASASVTRYRGGETRGARRRRRLLDDPARLVGAQGSG